MPNFNRIILIGHLTRDAELKYVGTNAVLEFSIAWNEKYEREGGGKVDKAHFFDCQIWGKRAEGLAQYLTKGKAILVEGQLKQERWDDKDTGKTRSHVRINASNVEFMPGGKRTDSNGEAAAQEQQTQPQQQYRPAGYPAPLTPREIPPLMDEEIPF